MKRALHLSPRQQEVLSCMALGHTNKEIAAKLGCKPRTVEVHRTSIYMRLGGVSNSIAAVRAGIEAGLLPANIMEVKSPKHKK